MFFKSKARNKVGSGIKLFWFVASIITALAAFGVFQNMLEMALLVLVGIVSLFVQKFGSHRVRLMLGIAWLFAFAVGVMVLVLLANAGDPPLYVVLVILAGLATGIELIPT